MSLNMAVTVNHVLDLVVELRLISPRHNNQCRTIKGQAIPGVGYNVDRLPDTRKLGVAVSGLSGWKGANSDGT